MMCENQRRGENQMREGRMKGRKNQREEEGELESMKGSCRGRRLGRLKEEKDVDEEIYTA